MHLKTLRDYCNDTLKDYLKNPNIFEDFFREVRLHKNTYSVDEEDEKLCIKRADTIICNTLEACGVLEYSTMKDVLRELVEYDRVVKIEGVEYFCRLRYLLLILLFHGDALKVYKELEAKDKPLERGMALSKTPSLKRTINHPINVLENAQIIAPTKKHEKTLEIYYDFPEKPEETDYILSCVCGFVEKENILATKESIDGLYDARRFINSATVIKERDIKYSAIAHIASVYYQPYHLLSDRILKLDKQISYNKFAKILSIFFQNILDININIKPYLLKKPIYLKSMFYDLPILLFARKNQILQPHPLAKQIKDEMDLYLNYFKGKFPPK